MRSKMRISSVASLKRISSVDSFGFTSSKCQNYFSPATVTQSTPAYSQNNSSPYPPSPAPSHPRSQLNRPATPSKIGKDDTASLARISSASHNDSTSNFSSP